MTTILAKSVVSPRGRTEFYGSVENKYLTSVGFIIVIYVFLPRIYRTLLTCIPVDHYFLDSPTDWNPGKLVYYGRAELKQSDHRPVIATIDIDVHCVDPEKRERVFKEVIEDLGPPDGTIIVKAMEELEDMDSVFDDNLMFALIQDLSHIGEAILVRYVGETIWVTFRDGQCALAAAKKGMTQVCGQTLKLSLKSPDWVQLIEKEIEICSNTTFSQFTAVNSPLRSPMQRLEQLEIAERPSVSPSRGSPNGAIPPPRPAPPGRPAQPPRSPIQERKQGPRAGVFSVFPSQFHPTTTTEFSPTVDKAEDDQPQDERLSPDSAIYEEIPDESPSYPVPNRPPPPLPRPDSARESSPSRPPPSSIPPPLPHRQAPPPPPQHPAPNLPPPPVPARTAGGPPIPARNPH